MSVTLRASVVNTVVLPRNSGLRKFKAAPTAHTVLRKSLVVRAEPEQVTEQVEETTNSTEKVLQDLKDKWNAVENKPQVALYAGGAVFATWLTVTVIGAVNSVPVLPKLLELVGLGYSLWFTWRFLLFKTSREELMKEVADLKDKITSS